VVERSAVMCCQLAALFEPLLHMLQVDPQQVADQVWNQLSRK
jgi:hypothetical protein